MLLSDRQRIVAEAGVLTLLGWMAATIAFNDAPRSTSGAQHPPLETPAKAAVSIEAKPSQDGLLREPGLPPELRFVERLIKEPKVKLPSAPAALPAGTVIRMGEGVHTHEEPAEPEACLNRSATGAAGLPPKP